MKILMLTPYLPYPPSSGGQVRSYNLIKNLSGKHEITLFSLIKDNVEIRNVEQLEKYCREVKVFRRPLRPWTIRNVLKTGFGRYPFLVIRNFSKEEKEALKKELIQKKYDLIHAENFYVMPHLPKTDIPILLTEQTILYRVYQHFVQSLPVWLFWLKPVLMIDVIKLKHWESFYWRKSDFLAAVSKDDVSHIKVLSPGKKVYIVPNGVDYSHFAKKKYEKAKRPTVLFGAADFHWMQNKEGACLLLEKVWPEIKKKVKNAQLWIVGKIAPKALSSYLNQEDVIIEEIDDSRKAYQRAWVLAAPIRSGGGSRTKFFEAMASGLPVVTTPEGIEGIDAKNNQEVVVEDDLECLANRTIEFLLNKGKAKKIGQGGRELVKQKYDWNQSASKLSALYEKIGHDKTKN